MGLFRNCKGSLNLLEGPIYGEEKEKDMKIHPVVFFCTVWNERNILAFRREGVLDIQKLKNSFVCNL